MSEREFEIRISQLVEAVDDRQIRKVVELVDHDGEGPLVLGPKHLAQTAFLLYVHQNDFAECWCLSLKEIGRELDVDELVLLKDVLEDDVGSVGIDDGREELVNRANNSRKALVNVFAQSPRLRLDFSCSLLIERMDEAVIEGHGQRSIEA